MYRLARETDRWDVLEGCVAIIMGCSAGIRPQEIRKLLVEDLHHNEDRPYVFVRHPKGEGEWGRREKRHSTTIPRTSSTGISGCAKRGSSSGMSIQMPSSLP